MTYALTKLQALIAAAVAVLLAAALAWQTYQLITERSEHGALKLSVSQENERRTSAALGAEVKTAKAESTHASATQGNSDAFTISQPVRDALARADTARFERLQLDSARRLATYRAMANACAATSSDTADRLEALDRQLVDGHRVVGALRVDLVRRDAEVVVLAGQIVADRALLEGGPVSGK